ncbi:MAG TPA: MAPEG family protein [Burkholderiales bacterium]|jgi:uncharacterized MAPEG superfamily protein
MKPEIYWLALTLASVALFVFPYLLNRLAVRGIAGTMANPSPTDRPQAEWAERARRAHANAVENLAVFAPAALAVHVLGLGNGASALACEVYFFSRLTHYVVYTLGIPYARSLAYFGGLGATAVLIVRLIGAA